MIQGEKYIFNIDTPYINNKKCMVSSPFIISGWLISKDNQELLQLKVFVNSELKSYATIGLKRQDVAKAFDNMPGSLWSGFAAEVFLDELLGETVVISLSASSDSCEEEIYSINAEIKDLVGIIKPRSKYWSYSDILACPICAGDINEKEDFFECFYCKQIFEKRRGIPLFVKLHEIVCSKILEKNPTNPYSEDFISIVKSGMQKKIVLDFGAGNPKVTEHFPNTVFHEIIHYPYTDVVSSFVNLPYKNGVFDAVISKAVFEHIPRPWETVNEFYRILKPGGIVHIDTAFMQPLHADPNHFFNMTLEGIRELFKNFKHTKSGIKNYQKPSYGLKMQIEVIVDHLHSDLWRRRFEDLLMAFEENDFDSALDKYGQKRLAAGVFFEGIK